LSDERDAGRSELQLLAIRDGFGAAGDGNADLYGTAGNGVEYDGDHDFGDDAGGSGT
jgi:hypothetical protein